jgi:uncharacterized membrane protein
MKRDTKIVLGVVAAIPSVILSAAALCSWAISLGASMQWRLLFRIMCHGRPERSLLFADVPMPICARCVGLYAGLLIGLAAFWLIPYLRERVVRPFALAALVPLALDGLTQLAGFRESTNELRIATGVLAGFAFGMWVLSAVERSEPASFRTS